MAEPIYFVEGPNPSAQDSKSRILQKWNGVLFDRYPLKTTTLFPEGLRPQPQDSIYRSEQKILMLKR